MKKILIHDQLYHLTYAPVDCLKLRIEVSIGLKNATTMKMLGNFKVVDDLLPRIKDDLVNLRSELKRLDFHMLMVRACSFFN
jgi:hypothetical protein